MKIAPLLNLFLFLPLILSLWAPAVPAQTYGSTNFSVTASSEEAREVFIKALLQLHNFEYDDSRASFLEARELDPDLYLSYWGEALTHWHPLWRDIDNEAARAALHELAPSPEARAALAPTERERDYMATLEILFGEGTQAERHAAYSDALKELSAKYPEDLDAKAFYALSILVKSGGRDPFHYMQAGAITEEILDVHPTHPGALHYNIHSYDDPIHSPLGWRAAQIYNKVAPAAIHALHMVSHIYYAMGLWEEGIQANLDSHNEAVSRQNHPDDLHEGETFHSMEWLPYGYLQSGQFDKAKEVILRIARQAGMHGDKNPLPYRHFINRRASYLVDTEEWNSDLLDIEVDLSLQDGYIIAVHHYITGLAALKTGDLGGARASLAAMGKPQAPAQGRRTAVAPALMHMQLEGQIEFAQGNAERALELVHQALELETPWPLDVGPSTPVKPSAELLGDLYRELGMNDEARKFYNLGARTYPNRFRTNLGLSLLTPEGADEGAEAISTPR